MTEERKNLIDSFFDFAENAVDGIENLSKASSNLWRFDEVIDNDTGETSFLLSNGHQKIEAYDPEVAERLTNLLNREGF